MLALLSDCGDLAQCFIVTGVWNMNVFHRIFFSIDLCP